MAIDMGQRLLGRETVGVNISQPEHLVYGTTVINFLSVSPVQKPFTVESLYSGHHWGMKFGLYRGVSLSQSFFPIYYQAF